jgi:signal transduction histidine kinase
MKVKNKLSLQFTFLFGVVLLCVLIGIYLLEDGNRKISFYEKLEDRAFIAGEFYLAQDNMTKENFNEVLKKYPQSLSNEIVSIYNDSYQPVFIKEDTARWSKEQIREVIQNKKLRFALKNQQVVGIYYIDNSGNFVVIVSATDDVGKENMKNLSIIMFFTFFLSLVITFFLGRLFATIALSPINRIIDNIKIIRATSLNKRLPVGKISHDEINQLSITVNNLLEHLEQSFQAQQSFIMNASHELRTPITSILGNAEIALRNPRETEEYKDTLSNIVKEAEKLNEIMSTLLELAHINLDNSALQQIRIDELLWEVTDEWGKPENSLVKVDYGTPVDLNNCTILGNRRLLFIALSNILRNAIKFSNNKEVYCTLQYTDDEAIISIKDCGIGIDKDDMEKIFRPFYRAANAQSFAGSGIGLYLTDRIIRLHNGKIEVESNIGNGTVFRVRFPV